jgi:hypothetical protein
LDVVGIPSGVELFIICDGVVTCVVTVVDLFKVDDRVVVIELFVDMEPATLGAIETELFVD